MNLKPAQSPVKDPDMLIYLPCSCLPGHFLCPEAERLWWKVNDLYRQATSLLISPERQSLLYTLYDQARQEYDQHYAIIGRQQP